MGIIAKVLSFTRVVRGGSFLADVKCDPGGGDNLTPEHFADSGDDSHPMPTDDAYVGSQKRTGGGAAIGYIDRKDNKKTGLGEKRIYGRDTDANAINEVWLKSNGGHSC